ncbi:tropomyosin-1, partial [Biomphalaria pfeifferi]
DVPTSVLKQQIQACSTKIETLSNTLVRVIGDLNTLKKPVGLESTNTSLSLEDNEKFVELKKKLCNSLEELETISKQIERVNKDLSDQKIENKEKLIFLENRLSNLENKIANSDTDIKAKFISLEKEWNKFQINTNTLEQRINKSENNINDIDHRLCQFQEKTSSILEEKEKELTVMSGEISSTIQDLVSLKEEGSSKSIKDMALTIKALEVWVKEDLQHKVADLEEPVKQLQLLNLDKAMEEHKSLLSDVISSQSLLGTKIQELEKKMKPRLVTIQQLCAMIKMGSRVKRGPNWNNQIHGNADGGYPSLGTVILEIPAYKKFRVKWDNGYENNYTVDPQMNFSEIQLASLPEID